MNLEQKRELSLPAEFIKTEYPGNYVGYTYLLNGKFTAIMFGGKRSKTDWGYIFQTEDKRDIYINEFILERLNLAKTRAQEKIDQKAQQAELFKYIEVGDIFHQGGGYDQTNCHFYQLISLKGKTGTFRAISMETVDGSEGFMSCQERPLKNEFVGEAFTSRIIGDRIKPGYDRAYKCSETATFYHSWYA